MAKLSNVIRINPSDFPKDDQQLVSKLAGILNYFMQEVVDAFEGNINFDNTNFESTEITVTVDSLGVPLTDTFFSVSSGSVSGIIPIKVTNTTNTILIPDHLPFIDWVFTNNQYKVQRVTGLNATNTYTIKLLIVKVS